MARVIAKPGRATQGDAGAGAGRGAAAANIAYVPPDHEPVLPAELVEILDPQPGETFLDCTFGAGGHARLIAERLGPDGELIAVDRDPASEERWRSFSADAPSRTRFLRSDFAPALEGLRGEGVRPDGIVFDLGMSSMQVDNWERGFSYAYDAPLDMRMDPEQRLSAARDRERVAAGADRARAARVRRGAPRRLDGARDRPPPPDRDHRRAGVGDQGGGAAVGPLRPWAPRQARLPGDPDRRQRRARGSGQGAAAGLAAAGGRAAGWARSPFTRSRTAA